MYALPVDLLIIQSSCHFHLSCKQGLSYAVAVFVCLVVCLFVCLFVCFSWENNGLRQLILVSFQWTSESDAGLWISDLDFYCKLLRFAFHIVRISDQGCLGVYSQSNLLDRMLRLHSYQPCPQDYCTNIQYNPQDGMLRILLLIGVI